MIRAYHDIVEFIASGSTSDQVSRYEASLETKHRVAELIERQKHQGLTHEEDSELEHYLMLEHVVRMAKARARQLMAQ